jgi:hypothetical protein
MSNTDPAKTGDGLKWLILITDLKLPSVSLFNEYFFGVAYSVIAMHVPNCRPLFKSIVFCLRLLSLLLFLKNTLHIPGNFSEESVFFVISRNKVSFICMFCRSLFVLLAFFLWSMCCLSICGFDYFFGIFKLFLEQIQNCSCEKYNFINI